MTLLTLGLVLAACSGGAGSSSGEVRTVAVRMSDDMRYDPTEFDFFVGERVRFEVTNAGALRHELFIGDVVAHEETPPRWPRGRGPRWVTMTRAG
ncbi:MAG: hypothetical protein WKH68_03110 [Candidatus Limnocylindria bacterium]